MSKSKGNVVDPRAMMDKYCADVVRCWAASCKLGDDTPFSEKDLLVGNKLLNKLWNASKFALMNLADYNNDWLGRFDELEAIDRWLLSKLNKVIVECTQAFEDYEHARARMVLDQFFWTDFCDNYMEIVKGRLYEPKDMLQKRSAQFAISHVLTSLLKLYAPFMPFITEEIYGLRFAKHEGQTSVHTAPWPVANPEFSDNDAEIIGAETLKIIEVVRKFKTENKLALNKPIGILKITTAVDLTLVENDLLSATKAQGLEHRKGDFAVEVETIQE